MTMSNRQLPRKPQRTQWIAALTVGLAISATPAFGQSPNEQADPPAPTEPTSDRLGAPTSQPMSFAEANRLYTEGSYAEAARGYETIASRGVEHEDLFYNLGNAYFRVGRIGPAVFNFERALRLDPGHESARFNRAVAHEVVAERFGSRLAGAEKDPLWVRTVTFFSLPRLLLLALALNVLFFGILIGLRFIAEGFRRTSLVVTNSFVGLALLVFVVLLIGHIYFIERVDLGVVLPDQVVMREGADERSAERGLLHPGLRVEVIGADQAGWLQIRLSNGVDGWVPDGTIGRLR